MPRNHESPVQLHTPRVGQVTDPGSAHGCDPIGHDPRHRGQPTASGTSYWLSVVVRPSGAPLETSDKPKITSSYA